MSEVEMRFEVEDDMVVIDEEEAIKLSMVLGDIIRKPTTRIHNITIVFQDSEGKDHKHRFDVLED